MRDEDWKQEKLDDDRPCEDCGSKNWELNDSRGERSCGD